MAHDRLTRAVFFTALLPLTGLATGCDQLKGDPQLIQYPASLYESGTDMAGADQKPPADLAPACPVGATCWDFSKISFSDLARTWMMDGCWQLQNGMLSTAMFPGSVQPGEEDCTAFLPTVTSSLAGTYHLKLSHKASIPDLGGTCTVYLSYPNSMTPRQILLGTQVGQDPSDLSFTLSAGVTFRLYLQLRVQPGFNLNSGAWQIQQLQFIPPIQ